MPSDTLLAVLTDGSAAAAAATQALAAQASHDVAPAANGAQRWGAQVAASASNRGTGGNIASSNSSSSSSSSSSASGQSIGDADAPSCCIEYATIANSQRNAVSAPKSTTLSVGNSASSRSTLSNGRCIALLESQSVSGTRSLQARADPIHGISTGTKKSLMAAGPAIPVGTTGVAGYTGSNGDCSGTGSGSDSGCDVGGGSRGARDHDGVDTVATANWDEIYTGLGSFPIVFNQAGLSKPLHSQPLTAGAILSASAPPAAAAPAPATAATVVGEPSIPALYFRVASRSTG